MPDATARTPEPDLTTHRGDSLPPVVLAAPTGGRYALGAEIARGGMGAVFRATDTALGREVAVKLLRDDFGPDSGTARRFAEEARIAGQLQHPGIPPVHDFGTLPDGRPFLAMKLIKGDTLDDLLKQRRDPSADRGRFVAVFEAVCQAVGYAHAHDVIHRDLKPANVMVGAFGEVQVMDWGLAKVLLARSASEGADPDATAPNTEVRSLRDSDAEHTQAGSVMGSPAYMPPEQAAGAAHKATPRSDVFGLGAVLAVVLTGRPPFVGASAETTRVKAAQGDVTDCLARLDACGAEPELVALCKRCLSPKPADRPADGGEVAAAVAEFRQAAEARARQAELDRVRVEGEKATAEATAAELRKRRKVQLGLAAAVVLLVAGAGAVAVWRVDEDGKKRTDAARLEGEERDRKTRAAQGVAVLLDQAQAALESGDADRAAPPLDQAEKRAADDAVADHADRLAAYRTALGHLRALDAVDDFRWTPVGGALDGAGDTRRTPAEYKFPPPGQVRERWAGALKDCGIVPGPAPSDADAARIKESTIRVSLVAALDGWLARATGDQAAAVRALLNAADPDPFRAGVRRQLEAQDAAGLAARVARPEWAAQPTGLVQAVAAALPPDAARDLLVRVVSGRPDDFNLLMALGATYPPRGSEGAAERARWHQAAAALRPRAFAVHLALGMALYDLGEREGAFSVVREAVRLNPGYALSHNNLGNLLRESRDLVGAAAAYREALRLDPGYAPAHANLGNTLYDKGEMPGAEAAYREAMRLDPKSPIARNNLGNVRRLKGDRTGAEALFREAIRLNPEYPTPHNGLGGVLLGAGDLPGAAAAFGEAVRLNPKSALFRMNLGVALRDARDWKGAAAAFREAVRLDPTSAAAHTELGLALEQLGDTAGALVAFRACVRLNPKDFAAQNLVGVMLEAQYDLAGAEREYREAVRLNPGYAFPHANLGDVYRKQGRTAEAVVAYRAALALLPNLGFARDGLAYCLRVQRGEVPTAPPPRAVAR